MKPFFTYYGGKWRDARRYPPPAHRTLVEPFAGSAGYAVRHCNRDIVLCDLDDHIVGVWRYLIATSAAEILSLPDLLDGQTVDDLAVPQEARWLIGFRLNAGAAAPCKTPSKWMRSGLNPSNFWGPGVRARIARQVDRIRHWRVFQCSYQDCPIIGPATWFIDPPYEGAGIHYRHGSRAIDYAHLGEWCRGRTGRVIVCENEGATWLPFVSLHSAKATQHKSRRKRSAEALWFNDVMAKP